VDNRFNDLNALLKLSGVNEDEYFEFRQKLEKFADTSPGEEINFINKLEPLLKETDFRIIAVFIVLFPKEILLMKSMKKGIELPPEIGKKLVEMFRDMGMGDKNIDLKLPPELGEQMARMLNKMNPNKNECNCPECQEERLRVDEKDQTIH